MTLIAGRFDVRDRKPVELLAGGAAPYLERSEEAYVGLNLDQGSYGVRVGPEVSEVNLCVQEKRNPRKTARAFKLDTASRTRDGGIILSGEVQIRPGDNYGFSVDGSNIVHADPYADKVRYFHPGSDKELDVISVATPQTSIDHSAERLPIDDLRIYEAHVKGLTALHPGLPKGQRGTLLGLERVAPHHLVDIGMNALELLPIAAYNQNNRYATRRGLTDYWGYNPDSWSAVHPGHSATGKEEQETERAFRALHKEGIAVILDVVYNHFGLDSRGGMGNALRALNKNAFHPKAPKDPGYSGVGESPNLADPMVRSLVLHSMRKFVRLGVDGFRFDLFTALMRDGQGHVTMDHPFVHDINNDPILKGRIMIGEPWDLGPYGYQVGNIGRLPGFKEWDDGPQRGIYDFWRSMGTAGESEYTAQGRGNPRGKVSFLTAHDGFTVRQSVTYHRKDNRASRQENDHGKNEEFWNSGHEGLRGSSPDVRQLRRRRMMSMYLDLILTNTDIMVRADDMNANDANNDRWSLDQPNSWNDWSNKDTDAKRVIDFRTAAMRWREQSRYFGAAANTTHDRMGRPTGARIETSYNVWGQVMADHEKGTKVIGQGLSDSFHRRDSFIAYKNGTHSDLVGARAITLPDDGIYEVIFNTAEETGMPARKMVISGKVEVPALALVLIKKIDK